MRALLTRVLSAEYQVEAAEDALEAYQAAKLRPPALIVIDLYFPGTDNLTLIRATRADVRMAHLPIIILTVSTHKELLLRCLADGASNFLLKPFNNTELLTCARVELQLRAAPAASGL